MADPIPGLNAALEGRYRIERELGEGGVATDSDQVSATVVLNFLDEVKRLVPN